MVVGLSCRINSFELGGKILFLLKLQLFSAEHRPHGHREVPLLPRTESTSEFQPLEDKEVEYFFASDASAVIEHTNRVIYLEVSALKILDSVTNNELIWTL